MNKEKAKEKAIAILQVQLDKLNVRGATVDTPWVKQTSSYIKNFFGEDSDEYKYVSGNSFRPMPIFIPDDWGPTEQKHLINARNFILNCIESVRSNGVYVPKGNFLSKMTDTQVGIAITIILFALAGFYTLIYNLGENSGRKSIEPIKPSVTQSIANGDTAKKRDADKNKSKNQNDSFKK